MFIVMKFVFVVFLMICRMLSVVIIIVGFFVLMVLMRGMIFFCMVYLFSVDEEEVFLLLLIKLFSLLFVVVLFEFLYSMIKVCSLWILIVRLFVLLNICVIIGNNLFLMVLKLRMGRMIGRFCMVVFIIEGVGYLNVVMRIGSIFDCVSEVCIVLKIWVLIIFKFFFWVVVCCCW